jgi:hypothetical protein
MGQGAITDIENVPFRLASRKIWLEMFRSPPLKAPVKAFFGLTCVSLGRTGGLYGQNDQTRGDHRSFTARLRSGCMRTPLPNRTDFLRSAGVPAPLNGPSDCGGIVLQPALFFARFSNSGTT